MNFKKENYIKEDTEKTLSQLAETFFINKKIKNSKYDNEKGKPTQRRLARILPWIALFLLTIIFIALYVTGGKIIINITFSESNSPLAISGEQKHPKIKEYAKYEEWYIPDWALASANHAITQLELVNFDASSNKNSKCLKLIVSFPDVDSWKGVYVETMVNDKDWSSYRTLSARVFLPEDAPENLKAKFILTTGKNRHWTEMKRRIFLKPGSWNPVEASIESRSIDWRYQGNIRDLVKNVRKAGIRIESDCSKEYEGSIYISDIKLVK